MVFGDSESPLGVVVEVPPTTYMDVSAINSPLFVAMNRWLRSHGKNVKPKLSHQQKHEFKECFSLMDEDGSGAIDLEELDAAFKLLGLNLKRSELEDLINQVDLDGTGELEYPEFLEVMTDTLYKKKVGDEEEEPKNGGKLKSSSMDDLPSVSHDSPRVYPPRLSTNGSLPPISAKHGFAKKQSHCQLLEFPKAAKLAFPPPRHRRTLSYAGFS
eukprot:gene9789-7675_t